MKPVTMSESVQQAAQKEITVEDKDGRKIVIRKPVFSEQAKLLLAIGPEASQNLGLVDMLLPLIYVVSIDGEPFFEIETLKIAYTALDKLQDSGMQAVVDGIKTHFVVTTQVAEIKKK